MKSKPAYFALLLVIIAVLSTTAASEQNFKIAHRVEASFSSIESAYRAGKINETERIFYNVQAVFEPEVLPTELSLSEGQIVKSGTHFVLDAYENWDDFSPEQQSLLADYFARPPYDTTYISPDSQFAVHYDTTGSEAVPSEDLDSDGIPDYVERVAQYADSSFRAYRDLLYLPAPDDGDQLYDIYLLSIAAYGITVPENPADSSWDDYTSYMQFHYSFFNFPENDDPEGSVIGAQKVTAAHEYFHAVQLAYNLYGDRWWMECTAVLFEELLFPEVNDNYQYLEYFYDYPEVSLFNEGWHMYASFVWPTYLVDNYGVDILRDIFEYTIYYSAAPSIDSALIQYGLKVEDVYPEFTLWNYFTADRAGYGDYFADAADYPAVKDTHVTGLPHSGFDSNNLPDALGANYVIFYPDPADDGYVRFNFDGNNTSKWGITYITFADTSMKIYIPEMGYQHANVDFGYYNIAQMDSIVIIPSVVSYYLDNNSYDIYTDLVIWGDMDKSGAANILDIIYLIDYKFQQGYPPPYENRLADFDCDGSVNILDIIYFIDYKFNEGPAFVPCPGD